MYSLCVFQFWATSLTLYRLSMVHLLLILSIGHTWPPCCMLRALSRSLYFHSVLQFLMCEFALRLHTKRPARQNGLAICARKHIFLCCYNVYMCFAIDICTAEQNLAYVHVQNIQCGLIHQKRVHSHTLYEINCVHCAAHSKRIYLYLFVAAASATAVLACAHIYSCVLWSCMHSYTMCT